MEIQEIEQLVELIKDADISELAITIHDAQNPSKIVIHKPLMKKAPMPQRKTHDSEKAIDQEVTAYKPPIKQSYITAHMVGIFHSIDAINENNTEVSKGQIVGQIESMKLMNDVVSPYDGVITDIFVEDGMSVEYGQHLFLIEHQE